MAQVGAARRAMREAEAGQRLESKRDFESVRARPKKLLDKGANVPSETGQTDSISSASRRKRKSSDLLADDSGPSLPFDRNPDQRSRTKNTRDRILCIKMFIFIYLCYSRETYRRERATDRISQVSQV